MDLPKRRGPGRPPGRPAHQKPLIDVVGARRRVQLIEKQIELALAGDSTAARLLFDRMDPALTKTQLAGDSTQPIALSHSEGEAQQLPTDVLEELEALAARISEKRLAAQATHPVAETKQ